MPIMCGRCRMMSLGVRVEMRADEEINPLSSLSTRVDKLIHESGLTRAGLVQQIHGAMGISRASANEFILDLCNEYAARKYMRLNLNEFRTVLDRCSVLLHYLGVPENDEVIMGLRASYGREFIYPPDLMPFKERFAQLEPSDQYMIIRQIDALCRSYAEGVRPRSIYMRAQPRRAQKPV